MMVKKKRSKIKKKPQWQVDFENTDVINQLQQIIIVMRSLPDSGGELTRICRLAIKRIKYDEAEYAKIYDKYQIAKGWIRPPRSKRRK